VHRTSPDGLAETIQAVLAGIEPDGGRVIVPPGLPGDWVEGAVADHDELTAADLDDFVAVVTGCAGAAAETGTIVLDGSSDQGRRAITLVPDIHICVVRADQIVQTVPELLQRLDPRRPLTFISGPSATSDIELNRVEGVHGPRNLHVVLTVG
jgi:L-lactate dehydrogenase complex protein LldG